jgi:hypothetical protein
VVRGSLKRSEPVMIIGQPVRWRHCPSSSHSALGHLVQAATERITGAATPQFNSLSSEARIRRYGRPRSRIPVAPRDDRWPQPARDIRRSSARSPLAEMSSEPHPSGRCVAVGRHNDLRRSRGVMSFAANAGCRAARDGVNWKWSTTRSLAGPEYWGGQHSGHIRRHPGKGRQPQRVGTAM